jgi:hypothetical protein
MITTLILFSLFFSLLAYTPTEWLFSADNSNYCQISIEGNNLIVNVKKTNRDSTRLRYFFPITPSYCSPQSCFPANASIAFLCLNYTTSKFTVHSREGVKQLDFDGRFARYDAISRRLYVLNDDSLSIYRIENGSTFYLLNNYTINLPPKELKDLHVFDSKIYILMRSKIYKFEPESGRLSPLFLCKQHIFPFQFISTFQERSARSIIEKNSFSEILSPYIFPLLSLGEFGLLLIVAYFCGWSVFKSANGRITVKPSTEEGVYLAPTAHT